MSAPLRALEHAAAAGAHSADAVLVESDATEARVRGDEIEHVTQARERTLGVRVFVSGNSGLRSALASTSDLSAEAIERTAREAVALAQATAEDSCAGLPEPTSTAAAGDLPELGLLAAEDREVPLDARIAAAREAERAARAEDPRITNSEGSDASSSFRRVHYANSQGFEGQYESAGHSLSCSPIAADESGMQTDYWFSVSRRLGGLEDPEAIGRRAAQRALSHLGARRVETCQVPVIFDAPAARSLLQGLVGCLSGTALYRGSSFLADRLGEDIASERITVVDDGRLPGGMGSRPFDGEGLPTRRNVLIERGRLCSYLLDSYSGRKLGQQSTGNASRSAGSAPGVGASNLWIEPGDAKPEELVQNTERGLLVTGMFGHGFNPVTGDFSRGAHGFWIEGGERAFPVEEITVAGNLGELLKDVDAVGDDLLWLGSVATPSLRVANLTVAGE